MANRVPRLTEVFCRRIGEARFPWEKFDEPKGTGGGYDPMRKPSKDYVKKVGPASSNTPTPPTSPMSADEDQGEAMEYEDMARLHRKAAKAWDRDIENHGDPQAPSSDDYYFLANPNGVIYAYHDDDGGDEPEFMYDPAHDEWGDA